MAAPMTRDVAKRVARLRRSYPKVVHVRPGPGGRREVRRDTFGNCVEITWKHPPTHSGGGSDDEEFDAALAGAVTVTVEFYAC